MTKKGKDGKFKKQKFKPLTKTKKAGIQRWSTVTILFFVLFMFSYMGIVFEQTYMVFGLVFGASVGLIIGLVIKS